VCPRKEKQSLTSKAKATNKKPQPDKFEAQGPQLSGEGVQTRPKRKGVKTKHFPKKPEAGRGKPAAKGHRGKKADQRGEGKKGGGKKKKSIHPDRRREDRSLEKGTGGA